MYKYGETTGLSISYGVKGGRWVSRHEKRFSKVVGSCKKVVEKKCVYVGIVLGGSVVSSSVSV